MYFKYKIQNTNMYFKYLYLKYYRALIIIIIIIRTVSYDRPSRSFSVTADFVRAKHRTYR